MPRYDPNEHKDLENVFDFNEREIINDTIKGIVLNQPRHKRDVYDLLLSQLPANLYVDSEDFDLIINNLLDWGTLEEHEPNVYIYMEDVEEAEMFTVDDIPPFAKFKFYVESNSDPVLFYFANREGLTLVTNSDIHNQMEPGTWLTMLHHGQGNQICSICLKQPLYGRAFTCSDCLIKLFKIPGATEMVAYEVLKFIREGSYKIPITDIDLEHVLKIINDDY